MRRPEDKISVGIGRSIRAIGQIFRRNITGRMRIADRRIVILRRCKRGEGEQCHNNREREECRNEKGTWTVALE